MREIIFDLIVFATGLSLGVVLAAYLFERKRREMIETIDASLDTIGIKRAEFRRLEKQVQSLQDMSTLIQSKIGL